MTRLGRSNPSRTPFPTPSLFAAATLATMWLWPALAWPCGAMAPRVHVEHGSAEPADEDDLSHDTEKMLYVDLGDGRWTVYQGRSLDAGADVEELAWLLPVPGVPDVEVAPRMIFDRLAAATEPAFELEEVSRGECPASVRTLVRDERDRIIGGAGSGGADPDGREVAHEAAVRAVAGGRAGPYDHVTIETREGVSDPGARALEWLEEHGYRLESIDVDLLREYLEDGMNLLAMRLRADAGAEDVQPVAITLELERALSPMRLARAGASDETRIRVWTAANGRALPHGWPRVEIDEGLIDWPEGGENYDEVVAAAIDEAGGRGLVTDYLGDAGPIADEVWSDEERQRWEELRASTSSVADEGVLATLGELFGDAERLESILRDEVPLPDARALASVVRLERFSARYRPEPAGRSDPFAEPGEAAEAEAESPDRGPGPEALLEALRADDHLVSCFADALEEDAGAGGSWSATLRDSEPLERRLSHVESSLSEPFRRCVAGEIESHLDDANYGERSFPAEVSFRFSNPYAYLAEDGGFPALGAPGRPGLDEIDWESVTSRIDDELVTPLRRARDGLDATERLTRLSAVVSADALTEDVSFAQVPGYDDLPAIRRATREIDCESEEEERSDHAIYRVRDWSVELERGERVTGRGGASWPVSLGDRDAARLVVDYTPSGEVVTDTGSANGGEASDAEVDENPEIAENLAADGSEPAGAASTRWWPWAAAAGGAIGAVWVALTVRRRPS